jgi:hypothetical protein
MEIFFIITFLWEAVAANFLYLYLYSQEQIIHLNNKFLD